MASNQTRRRSLEQVLQDFENMTAEFRSHMAGRTAAEMLYDEAVVKAMLLGHSVELAILYANQLYPSEALQVTPDSMDALEAHYRGLERVFFVDSMREISATPPPAQPGA